MSADNAHGSDTGTMDIKEHIKTWKGFVSLVKWVLIGSAILMILLAIFRTHG